MARELELIVVSACVLSYCDRGRPIGLVQRRFAAKMRVSASRLNVSFGTGGDGGRGAPDNKRDEDDMDEDVGRVVVVRAIEYQLHRR